MKGTCEASQPIKTYFLFLLTNKIKVGLTWVAVVSRNFLEAVVERQIVADGVLPAGLVAAVEGEVVGDVLVDLAERQTLLGRALDRHGDEGGVRVRRADHTHHVVRAGQGEPGAAGEQRSLEAVQLREVSSKHRGESCCRRPRLGA